MQTRFIPTVALAVGMAVSVACAGPAPAPAPVTAALGTNGVQQITVKAGPGVTFGPSAIAVRAGQPVQITLENGGGGEHDFVLEEGVAAPVRVVVGEKQSARGTFTIAEPGTYAFLCSIPGHAMAGMRGTITAVGQ